MTLEAIRYQRGRLDILDQLLLPLKTVYININDTSDAWNAIKKMQVGPQGFVKFSILTFYGFNVYM